MAEQFIAHYKVTGKLGAGGMGEVLRATDTKLNREVAIKVLPEEFAADAERVARFQREAEVLATLNHPNVAAIHGLEDTQGGKALILELVEGETLSERLKKGPLPVEEALEVCKQMAEALEAAHEKGIIHRDLKPGNVKFTGDGKVKVLDFGLAKTAENSHQTSQTNTVDADSPTITDEFTKPGTILGTAAYMSPEQARGKLVDKRSDIWSFGCVLYECLTGKCLFKGEEVTETLAKIIEREPDWSTLPENMPPTIHLLLRKCLAKDRRRRYQHVDDARVDLEQAISDPSSSFIRLSDQVLKETTSKSRNLPLLVGCCVAVMLLTTIVVWFLKPAQPPVEPPIRHLGIQLGTDATLERGRQALKLSADGSSIAYALRAGGSGPRQLYFRKLDELNATPIAGTQDVSQFALSPDGSSIVFRISGEYVLKQVSTQGGSPISICDTETWTRGIDWSLREWIVYGQGTNDFYRVPASGGDPEPLTTPGKGERAHGWPQMLPGGTAVLFLGQSAT